MNVHSTPFLAAILAAVLRHFPCAARGAGRPPAVAAGPGKAARATGGTPAARQRGAHRESSIRTPSPSISGNPNGTYLYLAYDMSAVLDDGNDLRILPIIGKGGYQNVIDVLHLRASTCASRKPTS